MSSVAIDHHLHKAVRFYEASIGKKAVMAATGVILFGYLVGHLAGNLQVYLGAAQMDKYAAFLHSMPALLWGVRALLVVSVVLHIVCGNPAPKAEAGGQAGKLREEASHRIHLRVALDDMERRDDRRVRHLPPSGSHHRRR